MRWYIIRTLLRKEGRRQLANRGGLALMLLLVGSAGLLSVTNRTAAADAGGGGGGGLSLNAHHCVVDYDPSADGNWINFLMASRPDSLRGRILFRKLADAPRNADGSIFYPTGAAAVQIFVGDGRAVRFCYAGGDPGEMLPFEAWFLAATCEFYSRRAGITPPSAQGDLWVYQGAYDRVRAADPARAPELRFERSAEADNAVDARSLITVVLLVFSLFFVSVYLLPSFTCEERERGVLLAQALSPASPLEILVAKLIFYPGLSVVLAALVAGVYDGRILLRPFFWCATAVLAAGSMGVGMVVASLARTQRAASLGALCYGLAVSLVLVICAQNNFPLNNLALEFHGPRILLAAVIGRIDLGHWAHLLAAAVLAGGWVSAAVYLFRTRGWQ